MHKNKNRPDYKHSKVGWIPAEWKDSRLKDCSVKIGSGITPKGGSETYLSVGIPMIRSQNVLDGTFSSAGLIYISDEQHEIMKGSALEPNDVLFNITGASIGRCCLFPEHFGEANVNQHVCIVRLKNTCHPKLFVNILNSHIIKRQLHENQAGGGREGLNFQNLGGFRIPTPLLPEQKAIAGVLECWDRGIRNLELKIEKKRLIKKGLMQRLLSGKQRVKGFYKEWKCVRLGDLGKLSKGIGISKDELSETGIPCIRYGEIYTVHDFVLKEFHSFINPALAAQSIRIKQNDLLFAGSGETAEEIGKSVAYMDNSEAYAGGDVIILSVFSAIGRADYLSYYLNTIGRESLNRLGQGQSVVHIYPKNLSKVCLTLPPLDEQQAIARVLSAADSEIEALEKKLALWKQQKKYLLNNLVTGTIRLQQFCVKGTTKKGKPCN